MNQTGCEFCWYADSDTAWWEALGGTGIEDCGLPAYSVGIRACAACAQWYIRIATRPPGAQGDEGTGCRIILMPLDAGDRLALEAEKAISDAVFQGILGKENRPKRFLGN